MAAVLATCGICPSDKAFENTLQEDERRPVMVWIHGGGFEFGASADPSTDGSRLAQKGIVLVSFNYRVGVLGFMAHLELDREGPSGDYGLQDQLAALRWVQANIARFGGDPDNVTVVGESAGAHALGLLMASPLAKGLMHKAIGESGAFWDSAHGSLPTFDEARARGVAFAARMGAASVAALRAMPAEELNAAAMWSFATHPATTAFSPHIDRYVVPEVPTARYLRGEQLHIPLLAGWKAENIMRALTPIERLLLVELFAKVRANWSADSVEQRD